MHTRQGVVVDPHPQSSFSSPYPSYIPRIYEELNRRDNPSDEITMLRHAYPVPQVGGGDSFMCATISTNAMRHLLPRGSMVIIDQSAKPKHGDLVCADVRIKAHKNSWLLEASWRSFQLEPKLKELNIEPQLPPETSTYVVRRYAIDDVNGAWSLGNQGDALPLRESPSVDILLFGIVTMVLF